VPYISWRGVWRFANGLPNKQPVDPQNASREKELLRFLLEQSAMIASSYGRRPPDLPCRHV
jgi:hypothetical protein